MVRGVVAMEEGLTAGAPGCGFVAVLARGFDILRAFQPGGGALFGWTERMPAEIMSWHVVVAGPKPELEPQAALREGMALIGQRPVFFGETGGFLGTPVYDRYRVRPGERIHGPAVLEERESTIIVPPDAAAEADPHGNLIIDLET